MYHNNEKNHQLDPYFQEGHILENLGKCRKKMENKKF
jgi:hypothetical protein